MVYVAMTGFVLADRDHDLSQAGVRRLLPVLDGDRRSRHVVDAADVDFRQVARLAHHRLLLEVADQSMRGTRGDQVQGEVEG